MQQTDQPESQSNKVQGTEPHNQTTEASTNTQQSKFRVIRRNGKVTDYDQSKIQVAMTKAFLAVEGGQAAASRRVRETVEKLGDQVFMALFRHMEDGGTVHIEDIQDQVELSMMRSGEHKAARNYVLYREKQNEKRARAKARADKDETTPKEPSEILHVIDADGNRKPLDLTRIETIITEATRGLKGVTKDLIIKDVRRNLFDGMAESDVNASVTMTARVLIEKDPNYSQVTARLLMDGIRAEALSYIYGEPKDATQKDMLEIYPEYFAKYLQRGVELNLLDSELKRFDIPRLAAALKPERDKKFTYLGLQTLYDRYFIHLGKTRIELPQAFFMRVSMGLAINEIDRETRAIEFYELLSSFDFMSSTPTLFNSGTLRPQLSSCYLTTVPDDLDGIFSAIKDDAMLSKYAGGLGNDWSRVRGMGSHIKGTNGESQGVVPFLKVANDTAVAVNQGGKRKGAMCAYLETWHIDMEEFLELRKNTGDDRRRTHDMNTANWIPDLFMERVAKEESWTLFSPEEAPELHELYGKAFKAKYEEYEQLAAEGKILNSKVVQATDLWKKMLTMLFETGHPWMTFKDPCNIRSPQRHTGVVHSSNLCTEITLNTSDEEIAVCNLGSVNLPQHINEHGIDHKKLEKTITTAMRMLDNVIDYNFYSVPQARKSNLRHRPVGLGLMGFQDALYIQDMAYATEQAINFADNTMEAISYYAIQASSDLADERGTYPSYQGSLWSQGILPIDSVEMLKQERGQFIEQDQSISMDWDSLRAKVKSQGMRNSNTMAIAPTATISNISGVSQSVEPVYQNLFVKSNLSGEFTVINSYLVEDLKALDLWDDVMVNDLKYFDGSVQPIDRIPGHLKAKYATAFEVDSRWLVEAASRRQKWIDQGQSLNLYMVEPSGKKLDSLYKLAWVRGLKTTYYLRSVGATHVEKSVDASSNIAPEATPIGSAAPKACSILEPDCDACQ